MNANVYAHKLAVLYRDKGADRFMRLVVGSLVLICALVALVLVKGARIREATFTPELATQNSDEWLLMHTNVPLGMVHTRQVSVSPSTPVSAISSGNEVAVQFKPRLQYVTRYTVALSDGLAKLTYSFMTPKGVCYYLISPGTIKEHTVGEPTDQVVYQAPFINEFALTGNYLAVVVQNGATDKLVIVNLKNNAVSSASLPQAGTIQYLKASPDGQDFSFTFTSLNQKDMPYYDSTLFSLNVPANKTTPVYGFNHGLLRATDWAYSPDGSAIVVQTFSSVIEAVYLNGVTPPLPIGAYAIIDGFSYDGSELYVGTLQKGSEVVNLSTRGAVFLNQAPMGTGSALELVAPLPNGAGYVMQVQKAISGSANYAQYVVLVQGNKRRILYASPRGTDAIASVSVSPNDQYVAVGISPTYFTQTNGGSPAGTLIIDAHRGTVVDRIPSLEQVVWQ